MGFCGYLKQSTAVTVLLGPFVDETDGKTAETGLTISQADVRLSKNAGNMAQKAEATSCTHDEIGYYTCPLDTTDTGTLGLLTVMVHESGALPVRQDYVVIPANEYDSLISGTDALDVEVASMAAGTVTATAVATGAIDADALAADAITAAKIADGAIDAATFAAGAITAAAIATNAIDADALAADALAEINAQVVDALATDTYAQPGQEAPAATQTLAKMLAYLYKAFRNKLTQTSTTLSVYDDAGTTVDQKATVSDDGSTYTRGEIGTGP